MTWEQFIAILAGLTLVRVEMLYRHVLTLEARIVALETVAPTGAKKAA